MAELIVRGLSSRQIAAVFDCSVANVTAIRTRVYRKLAVRGGAEAIGLLLCRLLVEE